MAERPDLTNQIFGKLKVTSKADPITMSGRKRYRYNCKCECGNTLIARKDDLISSNTKSCGCYHKEQTSKSNTKHGYCKNYQRTDEYQIWRGIIKRCTCKTEKAYQKYGAVGISICDRWLNSYENFYEDMGPRPTKAHSIDRINNNGNYEPSNCRWATPTVQNINQGIRKDNKSGITGVTFRKDRNKWIARIRVNNKRIHLGNFNTKEEAIKARKDAEVVYHNIDNLL